MSNDPYGYTEETASAPTDLSRVLWYGVGALMCAAVGPCLCYLPYLAAIPLGWMAIQQSKLARASTNELERTVGNVSQTSGIVGMAFGVIAIVGIGVYGLFLGGAMLIGAMGSDVSPPDEVVIPEEIGADGVGMEGQPGGNEGLVEPVPEVLTPPPDMPQE